MLRYGYTHQIGDSRCQINGAQSVGYYMAANGTTTCDERGAHVDVGAQIQQIRYIAMLPKEGRTGNECAGSGGIILVRRIRENHQIPGARGVRHVCCAAWTIWYVARFCYSDIT